MERGSITKWLFLGLAIFLLMTSGRKALFGTKASEFQPWNGVRDDLVSEVHTAEQTCSLDGTRFQAELSSHGASLRHFVLKDSRFNAVDGTHAPRDLVTTTREWFSPLRTDLRLPLIPSAVSQVKYDDLDWKLEPSDGKTCTFTYEDATTKMTKVVALTGKPFELTIQLDVKNLASTPLKHRFTIEQSAWHTKKEVEGGMFKRQPEFLSETVAVAEKTERHQPSDFEPGEFTEKNGFTAERWRRAAGEGKVAAVSSVYFSKLVVPVEGRGTPVAETQIQHLWDAARFPHKEDDPHLGYVYRARIAYPERELAPGESATYKALAFAGPKERDLLAQIDHGATEVLNLGYFQTIARALVGYLYKLYDITKSWGIAIVLLTITVRLVLFPLSLSQIKSSMAMRKLKPEMDAINEKYKDDAAQRGLAIQELWRKNNVSNPVVGCLPMLLQMPVWWALYTALQTAVELYHVPFLWFSDLTAPDRYFIIPVVLGASSFLQQKLMPAQGDPQQQKMMLYMMPGIFTFMMLFLPSGLGVYMFTNSILAIVQQLLVERYLKRHAPASASIEVREKSSGGGKPPSALGKGNARARG